MRPLPTGDNVIFLFTDIQDSSLLWLRYPDDMMGVVNRHLAVLTEVVQAHGGVHYKTIGDAVQAAFHTPADALGAAVAAQRRLATEAFPPIGRVLVRMSLHSGPASPVRGDYLAPCLNRLARLIELGWGGQILLSDTVRKQLGSPLPTGVRLTEPEQHRLRSQPDPEWVSQIVIDGLPDRFPPLRSLEASPTNLPAQDLELFGRDADVQAVRDLIMQGERLVTVAGTAGVGKTSLALRVASALRPEFFDGAWFVPLGAVSDSAQMPARIAHAIGVQEGSGRDIEEQLLHYLSTRSLLLVLDNLEQIAGAPQVVRLLLNVAPGLRILTTSRSPLGIRGEQRVRLDPLETPEVRASDDTERLAHNPAVSCFLHYARLGSGEVALDGGNAAAIAEICRRLDGLPLALELAAARVASGLTVAELLSDLARRFDVLSDGPSDLLPHQQTLWNTIAWSYDMLPPPLQTLYRAISVFRGGFTAEAASAASSSLGAAPAYMNGALVALMDASLLRRSAEGAGSRYFQLQSLQEFGWQRLRDQGELPAVLAAHLAYFQQAVAKAGTGLEGRDRSQWLNVLGADHDNCLLALDTAIEQDDLATAMDLTQTLWRYWNAERHIADGRRRLANILALAAKLNTELDAKQYLAAGTLARASGALDEADPLLRHGLRLARATGDAVTEAKLLNNLGNVLQSRGALADAAKCYEEAQALGRTLGSASIQAAALGNLGAISHNLGDSDRAIQIYQDALAFWRSQGDERRATLQECNLVLLRAPLAGHLDWAREAAARCLEAALRQGDPQNLATAHSSAGFVAETEARFAEALQHFEQSANICRDHEDRVGLATALGNIGRVSSDLGNAASAMHAIQESLRLFREIQDDAGVAVTLMLAGLVAAEHGDDEAATQLLAAATSALEALGAPIPLPLRDRHARVLGRLRADQTGFAQIWQQGAALDTNAAASLVTVLAERLHNQTPSPASARSVSRL